MRDNTIAKFVGTISVIPRGLAKGATNTQASYTATASQLALGTLHVESCPLDLDDIGEFTPGATSRLRGRLSWPYPTGVEIMLSVKDEAAANAGSRFDWIGYSRILKVLSSSSTADSNS